MGCETYQKLAQKIFHGEGLGGVGFEICTSSTTVEQINSALHLQQFLLPRSDWMAMTAAAREKGAKSGGALRPVPESFCPRTNTMPMARSLSMMECASEQPSSGWGHRARNSLGSMPPGID